MAQSLTSPTVSQLPIDVAVVIPTYNERENIAPLLKLLQSALAPFEWEVIFVDDHSPDGTADHVRAIAAADRRVRIMERIGRRGLSSACIEGMLATPAKYLAVMDADLQHDESILPEMLQLLQAKELDVVVASRYTAGGSMGDMPEQRVWLSRMGTRISRLVCRCEVSDPMSGFFVVERAFFVSLAARLTGTGYKILVDILASSPRQVRIGEVAYRFRERQHGESKLDVRVELEYLYLLIDKMLGRRIPTRFVLFVLVGSLGVLVHLGVLAVGHYWMKQDFTWSQATATFVAMTFNFFLNNTITFRSYRLRGWKLVQGLFTFYAACSLGALINVSFAQFLFHAQISWYLAGIVGMAVSSVWNYGANTVLTWRKTNIGT
jgi:dolichol-phosphate mannosyltransferase